jgi:hypothetical protein
VRFECAAGSGQLRDDLLSVHRAFLQLMASIFAMA